MNSSIQHCDNNAVYSNVSTGITAYTLWVCYNSPLEALLYDQTLQSYYYVKAGCHQSKEWANHTIAEGDYGCACALTNVHKDWDSAYSQQDPCSIHTHAFEVHSSFMYSSNGYGYNATSLW